MSCDFVLFKLMITGAALNFNLGDCFPAGWQADTTSALSECLSGRNAVISGSKKKGNSKMHFGCLSHTSDGGTDVPDTCTARWALPLKSSQCALTVLRISTRIPGASLMGLPARRHWRAAPRCGYFWRAITSFRNSILFCYFSWAIEN